MEILNKNTVPVGESFVDNDLNAIANIFQDIINTIDYNKENFKSNKDVLEHSEIVPLLEEITQTGLNRFGVKVNIVNTTSDKPTVAMTNADSFEGMLDVKETMDKKLENTENNNGKVFWEKQVTDYAKDINLDKITLDYSTLKITGLDSDKVFFQLGMDFMDLVLEKECSANGLTSVFVEATEKAMITINEIVIYMKKIRLVTNVCNKTPDSEERARELYVGDLDKDPKEFDAASVEDRVKVIVEGIIPRQEKLDLFKKLSGSVRLNAKDKDIVISLSDLLLLPFKIILAIIVIDVIFLGLFVLILFAPLFLLGLLVYVGFRELGKVVVVKDVTKLTMGVYAIDKQLSNFRLDKSFYKTYNKTTNSMMKSIKQISIFNITKKDIVGIFDKVTDYIN
jgi:hypothetical protein